LTVNFSLGGTATSGVDYDALPTSVTVPAGAVYTHLVLRPIADDLAEATESVELTLKPSPDYTVGGQSPFRLNIQEAGALDNTEDNNTVATAWGESTSGGRAPSRSRRRVTSTSTSPRRCGPALRTSGSGSIRGMPT
jgi:hypothetical protein